jgi:hypothetical protein
MSEVVGTYSARGGREMLIKFWLGNLKALYGKWNTEV